MAFSVGGSSVKLTGVPEALRAITMLGERMSAALVPCCDELGLFMEREIKLRTRVDTGRLRASIGHYTPSDMTSKATQRIRNQAEMAAIYTPPTTSNIRVVVGTRVVYAPVVNYKLGDHMFEQGLQATVKAIPIIVDQYIGAIRV